MRRKTKTFFSLNYTLKLYMKLCKDYKIVLKNTYKRKQKSNNNNNNDKVNINI